jgi:hypothetical protein
MVDERSEVELNSRKHDPPKRDERGYFLPGESGNPSGRPKGALSLTTILKDLLRQPMSEGSTQTRADQLMEIALLAAENAEFNFFREILDRIDGKVPERLQTSFGPGWEFVFESPPEPPVEIPAAVPEQGGDE